MNRNEFRKAVEEEGLDALLGEMRNRKEYNRILLSEMDRQESNKKGKAK